MGGGSGRRCDGRVVMTSGEFCFLTVNGISNWFIVVSKYSFFPSPTHSEYPRSPVYRYFVDCEFEGTYVFNSW